MYERQEGAFDNLWRTNPQALEDEYENTRGAWVDISELARAIAAAAGEVRMALYGNDIFESDAAYERCFDDGVDPIWWTVSLRSFLTSFLH
ncbi:MAG: hypothetical protein WBP56_07225 [Polyangia bacterium]